MKGKLSLTGETLESGIQTSFVLGADEALVLSAVDAFEDAFGKGS